MNDLKKLIEDYASAAVNLSWEGSMPAEEQYLPAIELEQAATLLELGTKNLTGQTVVLARNIG